MTTKTIFMELTPKQLITELRKKNTAFVSVKLFEDDDVFVKAQKSDLIATLNESTNSLKVACFYTDSTRKEIYIGW